MALYLAYGLLKKADVARQPFLLDVGLGIGAVTPVAYADGGTAPDVDFTLAVTKPKDGTFEGIGVVAFITPRPGKDLVDVEVTIVILPAGSVEGSTLEPGNTDFVVMELRNGKSPAAALIGQVGRIEQVAYDNDPDVPVDQRIDDEFVVEGAATGGAFPLHLVGGLASGPMVAIAGKRVRATGAYGEDATTIRGIDLARVRPLTPPAATSPVSATWFDVKATPTGPAPGTHLKVIVGLPHAGASPSPAPSATANLSVTGSLWPGTYQYRVTYAYDNGNESPMGPPSAPVTLPTQGAVNVANIPVGPAAPAGDPGLKIKARRIYRQGPAEGSRLGSSDALLVGELSNPASGPVPTSLLDNNLPIDIGGGSAIAAGYFRAPARLRVRYTADNPLDLDGTVLMVEPGLGGQSSTTYHGTVKAAPTRVDVLKDDRADLTRGLDLQPVPRTRLQWDANAATPQVTVQLPISIDPFEEGMDVRLDDAPGRFGVEWKLWGELLTEVDVRAQLELTDLDAAPPPFPIHLGDPPAIGRVAVRLGKGHPASAWPEGEATVGVELKDIDVKSSSIFGPEIGGIHPYGAIAVRGLRWLRGQFGDTWPGRDHNQRIRADVLLGGDPAEPPGGDRTLRFLRLVQHKAAPANDLRWWSRAGVLPERFSFDAMPITTGTPASGTGTRVLVAGQIGRIVGSFLDDAAVHDKDGAAGARTWVSVDGTGRPEDHDDGEGPQRRSLRFYADRQDTFLTSTKHLEVDAAMRGEVLGRRGVAHARLRVPPDVRIHNFVDTPTPPNDRAIATELSADPDGVTGRFAAVWEGDPVAARANPQVRMRRRPDQPSAQQLDAATMRIQKLRAANVKVNPDHKILVDAKDPDDPDRKIVYITDPVSMVSVGVWFDESRANRSVRGDQLEIDHRVPGGPRFAIEGRIGDVADHLAVELHKDESNGGAPFFMKGTTSSPLTDGQFWALPAHTRPAGHPRGELAGIGNLSFFLDEAPTAFQYVDFATVPFAKRGLPDYGGAEQHPRVHPPSSAATVRDGGFRLKITGRAALHGFRLARFKGDEALDLDDQNALTNARQWSAWHKTIVPLADLRPDPAGPGGEQTLWVWLYTVEGGEEDTDGKAFRFSDGLLADLAMRDYKLHDSPEKPTNNWDTFVPGTYTTTVYRSPFWGGAAEPETATQDYGKWEFDTDMQMKGFRGEITIVDAPSMGEKLGNPYGAWDAGPGEWYVRARDKLKLILYKGDLYMGNTGNGYHIPMSNGIYSTLKAIYNITWPP